MEQLWERSREGRKETNRKLSTGTGMEGMRNQAGEKEETEEARAETEHRESSCEAKPGRKGKEEHKAE